MVERLRLDDDEKATVTKPTEWIIFYEDGSTFSSDDGGPGDAPSDGVIVIAYQNINVGRMLLHSADYYAWHRTADERGEWVPHNKRGIDYYLSKPDEPGIYVVAYGIPYARWQVIYQQALDDPRLPFKSAWDWREGEAYAPRAERERLEAQWVKAT